MGTGNFYLKNASRYFVVCKPYEQLDENDEPTGEYEYEQWDYESDMEFFQDYLKKKADENLSIYYEDDGEYRDDDRDFPASGIGRLTILSGYFTISTQCLVRSGYYEAANLDWDIFIDLENGDGWDALYEDEIRISLIDYLIEHEGYDEATSIIKATANIIKLKEDIDTLIEFAEQCFAVLSGEDQYVSGGRFSNGEQLLIKTS